MSLLLLRSFESTAPPTPPAVTLPPAVASSFGTNVRAVDRLAFSLFGVPVLYQPSVGPPITVGADGKPLLGIFDEPFVLAKGEPIAGVEASGPQIFMRLEDIPYDLDYDDPTLTIRGVVYAVHGRNPDGLGGVMLKLRVVS